MDTLNNPPDAALQNLAPDNLIAFSQQQRLIMLDELGTDDLKLRHAVLNSLSKTAVDLKRLSQDDNNAMADREVAAALVGHLKTITTNPFIDLNNETINEIILPTLPEIELVPDEISTAFTIIEYDEIVN